MNQRQKGNDTRSEGSTYVRIGECEQGRGCSQARNEQRREASQEMKAHLEGTQEQVDMTMTSESNRR